MLWGDFHNAEHNCEVKTFPNTYKPSLLSPQKSPEQTFLLPLPPKLVATHTRSLCTNSVSLRMIPGWFLKTQAGAAS